MKKEKIEIGKIESYTRGIYYKKEEWLIKQGPGSYQGYHREDGPALTYYYKDGTKAVERWYNGNQISRPIDDGPAETEYYKNGNIKYIHWTSREHGTPTKSISYYENGNIMGESKSEYEDPTNIFSRYIWTRVEYYEDGTIREEYNSGTFREHDAKYNIYMDNGYEIRYYENGNIKYEKRGINKNSSLDKPIEAEYDINGNILKAKYFLYNAGYITPAQIDKCNKRLQSKRKITTLNPKTLEILYHLAKKYNYTDKIEQIEALLVANKLS